MLKNSFFYTISLQLATCYYAIAIHQNWLKVFGAYPKIKYTPFSYRLVATSLILISFYLAINIEGLSMGSLIWTMEMGVAIMMTALVLSKKPQWLRVLSCLQKS